MYRNDFVVNSIQDIRHMVFWHLFYAIKEFCCIHHFIMKNIINILNFPTWVELESKNGWEFFCNYHKLFLAFHSSERSTHQIWGQIWIQWKLKQKQSSLISTRIWINTTNIALHVQHHLKKTFQWILSESMIEVDFRWNHHKKICCWVFLP